MRVCMYVLTCFDHTLVPTRELPRSLPDVIPILEVIVRCTNT